MYVMALQLIRTLFVISRDADTQNTGSLSTTHSQQAMRRTALQRFREVEIIRESLSLFLILLLSHHLGSDDGATSELPTDGIAAFLALVHHFSDDVLGALNSSISISHLVTHIFLSHLHDITFTLEEQSLCQRFQSRLTSNLCTGSALRFERQINVFQFRSVPAFLDTLLECIRQFSLFIDRLENGFLTFRHLLEFIVSLGDGFNVHLVHITRLLLTVSGDERDSTTLFEQFQCIFDSLLSQFELRCDNLSKLIHHYIIFFQIIRFILEIKSGECHQAPFAPYFYLRIAFSTFFVLVYT